MATKCKIASYCVGAQTPFLRLHIQVCKVPTIGFTQPGIPDSMQQPSEGIRLEDVRSFAPPPPSPSGKSEFLSGWQSAGMLQEFLRWAAAKKVLSTALVKGAQRKSPPGLMWSSNDQSMERWGVSHRPPIQKGRFNMPTENSSGDWPLAIGH